MAWRDRLTATSNTITVDQDGGHHPDPAQFAVAAQQAA
jgi:hypothetical protein